MCGRVKSPLERILPVKELLNGDTPRNYFLASITHP